MMSKQTFWNSSSWGEGNIGTPIMSDIVDVVKSGYMSLKIEIPPGNNSRANIFHKFSSIQDWSKNEYIILQFYGQCTNKAIEFVIKDAKGKKQWWIFKDEFLGWKQLTIPLNSSLGWKQSDDYTDLSNIQSIDLHFTPELGDIFFLDKIIRREIQKG